MKKRYFLLFALFLLALSKNVFAYELTEPIPVGEEATIETKSFLYNSFYYNKTDSKKTNYIVFKSIKNKTRSQLPITMSIALYDKDHMNIGTINYCSEKEKSSSSQSNVLLGGEEKAYIIEVTSDYLKKGKNVQDVFYIALLNENKKCDISGSEDYIGKSAEQLNKNKKVKIDQKTSSFLKISFLIIFILLLVLAYKIIRFKTRNKKKRKE